MPMLHDPSFREAAKNRVKSLRPDAARQWGKMSVDQMLWHVNCGFENALGRYPIAKIKLPLPNPVMKFIVFNLPWKKGNTPTAPELIATGSYDFEQERARMLRLMDEIAARPMDQAWPESSFLGPMKGKQWSRLMGKHVDHHLKQFGA